MQLNFIYDVPLEPRQGIWMFIFSTSVST